MKDLNMSYHAPAAHHDEDEVELPFNRDSERSRRAQRVRNRSRNSRDYDDEDDGWN